jgi:hypothetical protein
MDAAVSMNEDNVEVVEVDFGFFTPPKLVLTDQSHCVQKVLQG